MTTILTIIVIIVIGFFIARLILKKSTGNSIFDKLAGMPLTITNRLFYYVILAGLSIVLPYILTMIFIIATGDRYEGIKLAVIPGVTAVHIVFGLFFIRKKLLPKILLTCVFSAIAFGLVWLGMTNEIITTGWDSYQFWDLAASNFIAGLILWETYFQIDHRLKKDNHDK